MQVHFHVYMIVSFHCTTALYMYDIDSFAMKNLFPFELHACFLVQNILKQAKIFPVGIHFPI